MKQTAVEWLVKELQESDYIPKDSLIMNYVIDQAKEMEKQQQGYSEEGMKQFGLYLGDNLKKLKGKTIDEIFEQFKKK